MVSSNRIAHTYLFTGSDSAHRRELALRFAQALNCERRGGVALPRTPGAETPPVRQAGAPLQAEISLCCTGCQKIERGTHPDVRFFTTEGKSASIKIEQVRNILHEASLKPLEGRWKVFGVEEAAALTLEAANALLKTLEEPPEHTVFLLLVENKSHLLETIQSRGVEIRVPPRPEKDPRDVPAIRIFSEGRDAPACRTGGVSATGGRGNPAPASWEPFFDALQKMTRPELQETLVALLAYVRNLCLEEFVRGGDVCDGLDAIYETLEALDQNVNQKLALTHLEIRLRRMSVPTQ